MERHHFYARSVLIFLAILSSSPGLAQINFVKTIGTNAPSNNGTTTAIAVPALGVGAGNSIILFFALNPGTGAVSCTDSRGNAYTVNRDITNGSGNNGVRAVILSAHNILALSGGNSISCTHPRVSARALSASEFAGLAASAPIDQTQSATGTGNAPSSGLTPSTSQQSELLIGAIGVEGPVTDTFTPGLSYAGIGRAGTSGGNAVNNITVNPEYRIVSTIDTYAANGTLSANRLWAAAIATYKAALPPAAKLVITSVNDGINITAGNNFSVVVQSQTESGSAANVITSTGVVLSLETGAGILGGTLTGNIAAGSNQVTITGVTYTKAESGVVITASRTSGDVLAAGDSAAFRVNSGNATKLVFTGQPGNAIAGSVIGGPPTIAVQDDFGNLVVSTVASIDITIGSNPGGGTLAGSTSMSANGGMASFSNLTLDKAGAGYTLMASSNGLSPAVSNTFNVTPAAASKLVFSTQPANAAAGNTIGGPPTVIVQDSFGNTVTTSTATIAMALGANPGGGTLAGTTAQNAGGGTVSFTNLSINKAGSGYTLTASSAGLAGVTSTSFNISSGPAAALVFTTQPGNASAGNPLPGPPTVAVQDSLGNTVTSSTASITIGLDANPSGATLSGTTSKNAVSGMASFTNLSLDVAGIGFTVVASASGLTSATSSSFNVTAAGQVSMAAIPTSAPAGDSFIVTWGTIPNPTYKDWIGLFVVGTGDGSAVEGWWVSCTHSATVPVPSGTCSFPTSTTRAPGNYEFRLFTNDTFDRLATSNPIAIGPPSSLNKIAVSIAPSVTAGTPGFPLTVRSQTPSGSPFNVINDTTVSVSLLLGTGVLGGTLNGTILAGTDQVVIGPVTYSKPESGVVLTVSRTSGDDLRPQNSLPFTVMPGPAAKLAFTTQPGNAVAQGLIPGPPAVTIQDNAGNPVSSQNTTITIGIATNPGNGILDGNMVLTSSSTVAFSELSISQPGNGYALVASANGLASAISNFFDVYSPAGGGSIAGVVTRVSNGATISGALVEAYQGAALRGTGLTNSSGNYSITGLNAGTYTVRASFTGLVPQIVDNVLVSDGGTTTIPLSLNFGIAVQSPLAGAVVNDFSVLVKGSFDTSLASEVGIKVNGYIALIDREEFATMVPLDSQMTTITATMTDAAGNSLAIDAVPITPQLPVTGVPILHFRPSPPIALITQPVSFTLNSVNPLEQIELDGNGDGSIDFVGTTLQGVSVTFADPGIYFPTVRATEQGGSLQSATSLLQVLDMDQLDASLQSKWNAMKNALRSGDTATAASHIVINKRAFYQNVFNNLSISFSTIDQYLTNISFVDQNGPNVVYTMTRAEGQSQISYSVVFVIDSDGVWRIKFF